MFAEDRYRTTFDDSKHIEGNMHNDHGVKYNNPYPLTVIRQEEVVNVVELSESRDCYGHNHKLTTRFKKTMVVVLRS